jgi:DNA-binding transcriptional LysR family regulator
MDGRSLLELSQLKYFQRVGQVRNITRAAADLYVSQPSVTVAIQKLEEELGVTLLDRNQKQISLTLEGRICLQRTNDILARVQDLISEMHDYHLGQKGIVKIGITPVIGAFFFPSALARFRKMHPGLQIVVIEEGSLSLSKKLERGELDLAMMITSESPSRLETMPVANGQLLVCFSQHHPLAGMKKIPFSKLRNQPFVMFREDTLSRQIIMKECSRVGFSPRIVFSSSQIETIMGMVGQGVGISFLLDVIVQKYPEIIGRPLSKPLMLEAGLAWSKDRYLKKTSRLLIEAFLQK